LKTLACQGNITFEMTRSCIKEIKKYLENEESENIVEEEVKAESV